MRRKERKKKKKKEEKKEERNERRSTVERVGEEDLGIWSVVVVVDRDRPSKIKNGKRQKKIY